MKTYTIPELKKVLKDKSLRVIVSASYYNEPFEATSLDKYSPDEWDTPSQRSGWAFSITSDIYDVEDDLYPVEEVDIKIVQDVKLKLNKCNKKNTCCA